MTARRSIDKLAPQVPETSVRAAPIDRADRAQRDAAAAFDIPKGIFTTPAEEAADFTIEDPPGESDAEIIRRLARMPSLDYERIRIAEAERLGCRAGVLDQLVIKERGDEDVAHGRSVALYDAEVWQEPVDLAELLTETATAIRRHVVLPSTSADAVALWIAHTYVYQVFDHTPRLGITSPLRRCGKSTLIDVLRVVSRRTLKSDSISASGVFRTVEALKPLTLLIDEADTFLKDNEELRGVLNSGFERSGQVIRVIEQRDDFVPVAFATFCPVVLAAIGDLPSTLADRSIPIKLQRKATNEKVEKLRHAKNREALATIARKFARWSTDNAKNLSPDPNVPDQLGDREGDICIPLLAIAELAGGAWAARAKHALLEIFGLLAATDGNLEIGALLLSDIRDVFLGHSATQMSSSDLCQRLAAMEDRPWPEWRHGKPITVVQLARAVQPFGLRPGTIRIGQQTAKGYHRQAFEEAWSRYLPSATSSSPAQGHTDPSHRHTPREGRTSPDFLAVTPETAFRMEDLPKQPEDLACDGVTDRNAPPSGTGVSEHPDEVVI